MTTSDSPTLTYGIATHIGGRTANADAATVEHNPLGLGAAVVDGIGSDPDVCTAARRAADAAAVVASHRGALAGIMTAVDTMPDHDGAPSAVAAVVSIVDDWIEIAHCGDCAVWTWSADGGLRRWTVDQTVGEHIEHMLTNPGLGDEDREVLGRLGDAIGIMGSYILNDLAGATVSTVSRTHLRGEHAEPDLILITSDGVHKPLAADEISALIGEHRDDPQALADALANGAVGTAGPHEVADNATAIVIRLTCGTEE